MKIETLKKSHLKRNIIIGVVVVAIISAVILNFTRAKYRVTESIPLVNGTINYSSGDLNMVAIYVNGDDGYTKSDTIPESGYELNEEESYCAVDGNRDDNISLSYDVDTKSLSVTPITTRGTKCYLYFDEKSTPKNVQELIASKNLATRTNFSTILTTDTTGTIYQAEDDDGTTYYFAGNPSDNWIYFADFYWRIIRINGDGSIRIIYNGTSNTTTGEETQIGTIAFNINNNDNAYMGYMYGTPRSDTYEATHINTNDSTVKEMLDNWYNSNLLKYASYIDSDAGFCNDRYPSTNFLVSNGLGGTEAIETYYGAYIRMYAGDNVSNANPSFKCHNSVDLFTISNSSKGNHELTYPIGLITVDEISYAGGVYNIANSTYYLDTGEFYRTISPAYFEDENRAFVFIMGNNGAIRMNWLDEERGVRPVINLKADTIFSSGDGTASNPYVVAT